MLRITEPFNGAVLNHRHGQAVPGGLRIEVAGEAAVRDCVTVNGAPARRAGARFSADVVLGARENEIVAVSDGIGGRHEHRLRVLWDRHSFPRYRFSIDDNSFFLRDIAHQGYTSLFDCHYLHGLRDLNQRYGTRFVLNVYYTTGDDFDLRAFSDRYRSEWRDHAHWLKLAFHARANDPDRPYQYASTERLLADLDQVAEQIHRFAGAETYSPPTVIHWGMVQPAALRPLAGRGVRVLSGYFMQHDGVWDVNYLVDEARSEYLSRHTALADFESGILYSRIAIVVNTVPLDRIVPTLEAHVCNPDCVEVLDLFTHEQYFWPFYHHYLPDHFQRMDLALRWVTERGYRPVFYHEGLLGGPD